MSVTFVSAQTGFVLGQVPCRGTLCYGLATTADAGRTWSFVADLPMAPQQDQPVAKVRFANAHDGWVFGPQLWATHDGGASWHQLSVATRASDLEAAAGVVYLIGSACALQPCAQTMLLRSLAVSDQFVAVPGATTSAGYDRLALHGKAVWVWGAGATGVASTFLSSPDGASWHVRPDPCPTAGGPSVLVGAAPVTTSTVFFLCAGDAGAGSQSKVVLGSTDAGITSHPTGSTPPRGGIASDIAAASASVVAVSALSGASWIYRSADAGATWATGLEKDDGGRGFNDLGFTTSTQGVAVQGTPGNSNPSKLMMTRDAGVTWTPVVF